MIYHEQKQHEQKQLRWWLEGANELPPEEFRCGVLAVLVARIVYGNLKYPQTMVQWKNEHDNDFVVHATEHLTKYACDPKDTAFLIDAMRCLYSELLERVNEDVECLPQAYRGIFIRRV